MYGNSGDTELPCSTFRIGNLRFLKWNPSGRYYVLRAFDKGTLATGHYLRLSKEKVRCLYTQGIIKPISNV